MSNYSEVAQIVFDKLLTDTTLPTAYFQNVDYKLPSTDFLSVTLTQADASNEFLGTRQQNTYLLQVNICVLRGKGLIKASDIGQKIITLFSKNTKISTSPLVTVDRQPYYSAGFYDEKWYILPLKITVNSIV